MQNIVKLDTNISANVIITNNDPVNNPVLIPVNLDVISGLKEALQIPTTFEISSNYPNPFNPVTNIRYQLPEISDVKLVVYNLIGQKIRTLVDGQKNIGYYNIQWDGLNDNGHQAATGIYIYRFEAGDFVKSQKMILMK